jgi:hypothetical protein
MELKLNNLLNYNPWLTQGFGLVFCLNPKRDLSLDLDSYKLLQNRKFKLN